MHACVCVMGKCVSSSHFKNAVMHFGSYHVCLCVGGAIGVSLCGFVRLECAQVSQSYFHNALGLNSCVHIFGDLISESAMMYFRGYDMHPSVCMGVCI